MTNRGYADNHGRWPPSALGPVADHEFQALVLETTRSVFPRLVLHARQRPRDYRAPATSSTAWTRTWDVDAGDGKPGTDTIT
jgi:hypothetical protein